MALDRQGTYALAELFHTELCNAFIGKDPQWIDDSKMPRFPLPVMGSAGRTGNDGTHQIPLPLLNRRRLCRVFIEERPGSRPGPAVVALGAPLVLRHHQALHRHSAQWQTTDDEHGARVLGGPTIPNEDRSSCTGARHPCRCSKARCRQQRSNLAAYIGGGHRGDCHRGHRLPRLRQRPYVSARSSNETRFRTCPDVVILKSPCNSKVCANLSSCPIGPHWLPEPDV